MIYQTQAHTETTFFLFLLCTCLDFGCSIFWKEAWLDFGNQL